MEDEQVNGENRLILGARDTDHAINLNFTSLAPPLEVSLQASDHSMVTCNTSPKNSDFAMQSITAPLQTNNNINGTQMGRNYCNSSTGNESDLEPELDLEDDDIEASLQESLSTSSNVEIQLANNDDDDGDLEDIPNNISSNINSNSIDDDSMTNTNSINQSRNASQAVAPGAAAQPINNINGAGNVKQVELFGVKIVALTINSRDRLCLAQISNTLLKEFSYNEIHNRRVALGITCVQCTPIQLEMLRRAGAMPSSSRRCGMITMREAERLCRSFLVEEQPPELPDNFYFTVAHRINYGCRGRFVPARYISSRAKCIECFFCGDLFSPNKFIFHSHRKPHASECNPPDSPNINSWRKHIDLDWTQEHSQEIKYAWEDVKSLFNGGTRKRGPVTISGPVSCANMQGGVEQQNNHNNNPSSQSTQQSSESKKKSNNDKDNDDSNRRRSAAAAAIGFQCSGTGGGSTSGTIGNCKRIKRAPNSKQCEHDHVDVDGDDDELGCVTEKFIGGPDELGDRHESKLNSHHDKPERASKQRQHQTQALIASQSLRVQPKHHATGFSDWHKFARNKSACDQAHPANQKLANAATRTTSSDHGYILNMQNLLASQKRNAASYDTNNQLNSRSIMANNLQSRQQQDHHPSRVSGQQQQGSSYNHFSANPTHFLAPSSTSPRSSLPSLAMEGQNIVSNPQQFTQGQLGQPQTHPLIGDSQVDSIAQQHSHVKQQQHQGYNTNANQLAEAGFNEPANFPQHHHKQQHHHQHQQQQLMMNRVESAVSEAVLGSNHCTSQQTSQQMALRQQFWSSLFANLQSANNGHQGPIVASQDFEQKAVKTEMINNGQLLHSHAQFVSAGGGGISEEPMESNGIIFPNLNPLGHLLAAQLSSQAAAAAAAANLTPNLLHPSSNNQRQFNNNDNISVEHFMQIANSRGRGGDDHTNANPFAGLAMNLIAQQNHHQAASSASPSDQIGFLQRGPQSTSNDL